MAGGFKETIKEVFSEEGLKYLGVGAAIGLFAYLGMNAISPTDDLEAIRKQREMNRRQVAKRRKYNDDKSVSSQKSFEDYKFPENPPEKEIEPDTYAYQIKDDDKLFAGGGGRIDGSSFNTRPPTNSNNRPTYNSDSAVDNYRSRSDSTNNFNNNDSDSDSNLDTNSNTSIAGGGANACAIPGNPQCLESNEDSSDSSADSNGSGSSGSGGSADSPGSPPAPTPLVCSLSQGAGIYPPVTQSISITCNESASVLYTLSTGACGDPLSAGVTYSTPVDIGPALGSYCLSFYATADDDGETLTVVDTNYTISMVAALSVSMPIVYAQTTELPTSLTFSSTDFANNSFGSYRELTVVNYKSNDPGPSGLNLDCADAINTYSVYTSPSPYAFYDSFITTAAGPYVIQPSTTDLIYGVNHFASGLYDPNSNTETCVLSNFTLLDFDYLHQGLASGSTPVSGGIRELTGGFTSFGHFDVTANSTTSGPSTEAVGGATGASLDNGYPAILH